MMSIPLFTSIPPRISRDNAAGDDIGEIYQHHCIESWYSAGFEPISVNTANEFFESSLRIISVKRDASSITGRPHVFFADLLGIICIEARGRPFALMNADLVLKPPSSGVAGRVAQLRRGEFIFSRRLEVDQPDQTEGTPHWGGYDFFAGHADELRGLPDAGMVFGAPWWDHYFPLMMLMRGCRISQIRPTALHLKHPMRWSWSLWEALGHRFVAEMKANAGHKTYKSRFDDAVRPRTEPRLPNIIPNVSHEMLRRVSNVNVAFLDEYLEENRSSGGDSSLAE